MPEKQTPNNGNYVFTTEDKIFLLSKDEVFDYFEPDANIEWYDLYRQLNPPDRGYCKPTAYVWAQGMYVDDGHCGWWLYKEPQDFNGGYTPYFMHRSIGFADANTKYFGVRPALWIDLKP